MSALAIGLLSLSYISYYSAEKNAEYHVGGDFAFSNQDADNFKASLKDSEIDFKERNIEVLQFQVDIEQIVDIH